MNNHVENYWNEDILKTLTQPGFLTFSPKFPNWHDSIYKPMGGLEGQQFK